MRKLDKYYIGGEWVTPNGSQVLEVLNPATETACLEMACADEQDVNRAVRAARTGFTGWSRTSAHERAEILMAVADIMDGRAEDLIDAHTMTMGIPRHQAMDFQIAAPIGAVRYFASLCDAVDVVTETENVITLREPIGVCALINPWNYPLMQMIGKVIPALAVGCAVIAKPAEQTPLSDVIMAEIFHEAGLPAGVFNLIMGIGADIGTPLCSHPEVDMVSFTGSTAAGIKVAQAAAPSVKRVCQELGGKSPLIITDGADLEAAVTYGVENVMLMGGQTCDALTRMYVSKDSYEEAIAIAKRVAEGQIIGDPLDPNVTMGPLASLTHRERVLDYINIGISEGARLVTGGPERPEGLSVGAYVKPTIFADVTPDMIIAKEEIFGPVLCIMPYGDLDNAVAMANDSIFGLSSAVYAKDKAEAISIANRMEAGQCYIQGGFFSIHAPFGGYKQSGNGREWAEQGLHEYLETKAIICG